MLEPTPQLSRRDEFAKAAMVAMLQNNVLLQGQCEIAMKQGRSNVELLAAECRIAADALIAELDRTTPQSDA